jgi:hypothetical protein
MFIEDELASLDKLEVLWILGNELSVLSDFIDYLKRNSSQNDQYELSNNLLLMLNRLIKKVVFTAMNITSSELNSLKLITYGIAKTKELTAKTDIETLWNEWNKLSDFKQKTHNLKNLRELYCDGLECTKYGPVKSCPEGLVVYTEESVLEGGTPFLLEEMPAFLLRNDAFEKIIELKDHYDKSLIEKIDFMGWWP